MRSWRGRFGGVGRGVLNFATGVSVVLCFWTAVLWGLTRRDFLQLSVERGGPDPRGWRVRDYYVTAAVGTVALVAHDSAAISPDEAREFERLFPRGVRVRAFRHGAVAHGRPYSPAGLGWLGVRTLRGGNETAQVSFRSRGVRAPCGVLVIALAVLPLARLGGLAVRRGMARRRGRRAAAGLCPACGYDLRATPGRCPECGAGSGVVGGV